MPVSTSLEANLADTNNALRHSVEVDTKKGKKSKVSEWFGKSIEQSQATGSSLPDMSSPGATAALQIVQSEIDKMTRRSEILLSALGDLQQIHPFVSIAVLALKTAIKLEVTRRDNDKRVLTIRIAMNDLFSVILLIKDIPRDSDKTELNELSIKSRFEARLKVIADDIRKCSGVCDTFQNKRTIVKLFTSLEWEKKFEDFLALFKQHQENIHADLMIVIGTGMKDTQIVLDKVAETTSMTVLLQLLRSPEERELQRFINSKGGPTEFLKNDSLMQELVKKSGESATMSSKEQTELFQEIKREVKKTVTDAIEENFELFSGKFEAQQEQLKDHLDIAMQRQSDRIIHEFGEGPHKRITDPDLKQIWKEMGWKTTVKARQMVMALREYYSERRRDLQSKDRALIDSISSVVHSASNSPKQIVLEVTELMDTAAQSEQESDALKYAQDDWALEYITITRIQPLLEAFDDDSSSLVSVAEEDDSLPKWMAYWTAGFPLTLKRYYTLIQILLWEIEYRVPLSLQVNKQMIKIFVSHNSISGDLDQLFAGVREAADDIFEDNELDERFKEFVVSEENRMQKMLHILKYRIDAENTLRMVTGPGRLEKYIMPLLYLLFVRVYQIVTQAMTKIIDPKEVFNLLGSFEVIYEALSSRVESLKAVCKLQNLDAKEQFRRISYGIFYYMEFREDIAKSMYWQQMHIDGSVDSFEDVGRDTPLYQVSDPTYADGDTVRAITPGDLFYPGVSDSLDFEAYDENTESGNSDITQVQHIWHGFYTSQIYSGAVSVKSPEGLMDFHLPEGDGPISGGGSDAFGEFSLTGQVDGQSICFNISYVSGAKRTWRYDGELNSERDVITGKWGPCDDVLQNDLHERLQESDVQGEFEINNTSRAIRKYVEMNDDITPPESLPRTRWQLAIKAVIAMLRLKQGLISATYLKNRRKIRHRFLKLLPGLIESESSSSTWQINKHLSDEEMEELSALISYCSRQDVRFYRSLSASLRGRVVVHWNSVCDWENEYTSNYNLITGTRFVCIGCLRTDPETRQLSGAVDLCDEHMDAEVDRPRDEMHHTSSHDLIQLRYCCSLRAEGPLLKTALDIANHLRSEDSLGVSPKICRICDSTLERPYWCCLSCSGVDGSNWINICMSCKDKLDNTHSEVLDAEFVHSSDALDVSESEQANDGAAELDAEDPMTRAEPVDEPETGDLITADMPGDGGSNAGDAASDDSSNPGAAGAVECATVNEDSAAAENDGEEPEPEPAENSSETEKNQSNEETSNAGNAENGESSAESTVQQKPTHIYHK
ncbi:hypothetical protein D9757_013724 [Collybiopsis confluens]|uniref:Uncharacterized protein n=1 Tax=Collybiopsis confluens TaxID=2823264 RepID=A0A8H5FUL5_9AGAR|nr:hypothetical protein D9757_013724 [Collybiopsis confluens]